MGAPETGRERGFPECSTALGCTIKVVVRNWRIWPSAEAADDARVQATKMRIDRRNFIECNAMKETKVLSLHFIQSVAILFNVGC